MGESLPTRQHGKKWTLLRKFGQLTAWNQLSGIAALITIAGGITFFLWPNMAPTGEIATNESVESQERTSVENKGHKNVTNTGAIDSAGPVSIGTTTITTSSREPFGTPVEDPRLVVSAPELKKYLESAFVDNVEKETLIDAVLRQAILDRDNASANKIIGYLDELGWVAESPQLKLSIAHALILSERGPIRCRSLLEDLANDENTWIRLIAERDLIELDFAIASDREVLLSLLSKVETNILDLNRIDNMNVGLQISNCLDLKARIQSRIGQRKESADTWIKSEAAALGDPIGSFRPRFQQVVVLWQDTKMDSAVTLAKTLVDESRSGGNEFNESMALGYYADSLHFAGFLEEAVEQNSIAIGMHDKAGRSINASKRRFSQGQIQVALGEKDSSWLPLAKRQFEVASIIFRKTGEQSGFVGCHLGLATVSMFGGDLVDAKFHGDKALELAVSYNLPPLYIGRCYALLARISACQGKTVESEKYFRQFEELAKEAGTPELSIEDMRKLIEKSAKPKP